MNAAIQKPEARSQNAEDLLVLSHRIRETEAFLDCLRRRRDAILDNLDQFISRRLDPAAQEKILEDILSTPGPLDQKLAQGMRIVHEPPVGVDGSGDDGPPGGNGDDATFDPDPDFAQRVADEAKQEAAEMAQEQARHICEQLPEGGYRLDCHECGREFTSFLPTAHCPECLDKLTDSNGQA